jgi:beta-phosphoglucomutase family hydrolase
MNQLTVHPDAKGLIFDLDGTLVDSMPLHYEAWKEVCALGGHDFSEEEFYSLAGVQSEKIFGMLNDKYGTDFEPKSMSQLKEDTYLKKIDQIKPVQAVLEIVQQYFGKLPMAVGTGSPKEHSMKTMRALDYEKYFEILVAGDEVEKGKPHPETFLRCAEAMGVEPQYCHVFEDGDPGIQAARTAGMFVTDIRPFL